MSAQILQLPPPKEKFSKQWDLLANWKATDPVPGELYDAVPAMREEGLKTIAPATAEQMAIFLGMLEETANALRWPGLAPGAARLYVNALADVPADLLALALDRLVRDWTWPRLPTPADIRKTIADELSNRKIRVKRLHTVEIFWR